MTLSDEDKKRIEEEEQYRSEIREEPKKKKSSGCFTVIIFFIIIIVLGTVISAFNQQPKSNIPSNTNSSSTANNSLKIGDKGYLRLPNISDPTQVIFLAEDKDSFNQLSKSLIAKDTYGIMELGQKGVVFGVSNGTEIQVIDSDVFIRKVRIIKGVRSVDNDKVGLSGWVPVEWAVAN